MGEYVLTTEDDPAPEDVRFLVAGLVEYNTSKAEPENYRPLTIFLRDRRGQIVGGLRGHTGWGWLFISHLWLSEAARGRGYGTELVAAAEREAVTRGCRHAHLDTFSFQARAFYEGLGYEVFGALEDYPRGHTRFYLRKHNLADGSARRARAKG